MDNTLAVPGLTFDFQPPPPAEPFLTGVPLFVACMPENNGRETLTLTSPAQVNSLAAGSGRHLRAALHGFFANGGSRCVLLPWETTRPDPVSGLRQALASSAALEEVDLVCAPEIVVEKALSEHIPALQNELLDHCRLLGTRLAILDPLLTRDVAALLKQRKTLRSEWGALYHSWLYVDQDTAVPPCGHIAGSFAAIDAGGGVHRAPANVELLGVVDLHLNPDHGQTAELAAAGLNCLRVLPGRGIRIWGARTLSSDPNWQHIAVRRLFITLHRWLEQFMQTLAFEPNDVHLWIRITREITAFLEGLYRQGVLWGETAERAFYVKCDGETTTPARIGAGQVVVEIGLVPAATAEQILIKLVQQETAVTVAARSPAAGSP